MTTEARLHLQELRDDCINVYNWMTVRDFCVQTYGSIASKAIVETYGEYNDEGGTDYRISELICYDSDGERLEFSLFLPFWQADHFEEQCFHHLHQDYATTDDETKLEAAKDALKDLYLDKNEREIFALNDWVRWEDLPCDEHNGGSTEYDLTTMPPLRLKR